MKAKRIIPYAIILLSGCIPGLGGAIGQINLDSGLVAYYPFTGNANDASGHGNNATINDATLTTDRFGNANSAYYFNGVNNYIMIPNSPSLNSSNQLSLYAEVKPMGFYYGSCHGNSILMKGDQDFLPGNYYLRFDDAIYTHDNNCFTNQVDTLHQLFYGLGAEDSMNYIQKGTWYCVVYTYDGENAKFYVDGVMTDSVYSPGYSFSNAADLYLGHMNNVSFPYWYNGVLDEIRIYNRALDALEVDSLCEVKSSSSPLSCPPLQGTLMAATVCSGSSTGMLTFDSPDSTGPFTLTLSDNTTIYTEDGVVSDVPFAVPLMGKDTYVLTSIMDTTLCPATAVTGVTAAFTERSCAVCADSVAAGWAIPSGFTPNGDGHNDCFGIARPGAGELEEFSIYDRWGQRVFTTANAKDCWDGNISGRPANTGTYVYMVRLSTRCGEALKKGTLMLVR